MVKTITISDELYMEIKNLQNKFLQENDIIIKVIDIANISIKTAINDLHLVLTPKGEYMLSTFVNLDDETEYLNKKLNEISFINDIEKEKLNDERKEKRHKIALSLMNETTKGIWENDDFKTWKNTMIKEGQLS